jgi:hypothetical protein
MIPAGQIRALSSLNASTNRGLQKQGRGSRDQTGKPGRGIRQNRRRAAQYAYTVLEAMQQQLKSQMFTARPVDVP